MKVKATNAVDIDPPSSGAHNAVLAEVADLGVDVHPEYGTRHQGCLVFQLEEEHEGEGELQGHRKEARLWFDVGRGFGAVKSRKGGTKLRKYIEGWRGKAFSTEELLGIQREGYDLDKLIGRPVTCVIVRETKPDGGVYGKLVGLEPPKKSNTMKVDRYKKLADRDRDGDGKKGGSSDKEDDDDIPFNM